MTGLHLLKGTAVLLFVLLLGAMCALLWAGWMSRECIGPEDRE